MRKILIPLLLTSVFAGGDQEIVAIGRGGGGRVGGGGGGRAPASLPARTPSISSRPAPATRPANISRPGKLPSTPKVNPPRPTPPKFDSRPDFKLPGNFDRPMQLPKADRPPVVSRPIERPDLKGVGGKLPAGKDRFPDISGKFPDLKDKTTRPKMPDLKDKLPDLSKKNPGLFDRPGQLPAGIPGAGKLPGDRLRPGDRPSREDIGNWLDMPRDRPGGGTAIGRFDNKEIKGSFNNKWQSAIKNSGNKFVNVDLSKNVNYQNLSRHRNVVNNNFRPYSRNWFNDRWWDGHGARPWPRWHYHWGPRPPGYWWRPVTWPLYGSWLLRAPLGPPVYYDYGQTVVVQNDVVYIDQEPISAAPVYAQQSIELAEAPPPAADAQMEWLPLGTWALMSREDDANPDKIIQLALSKEGIISGALFSRATDKAVDLAGRVDPETQRVAIADPKQPDVVLEVGLYNLTKDATPCLIHFGTTRTQTWYLVRLENPEEKK